MPTEWILKNGKLVKVEQATISEDIEEPQQASQGAAENSQLSGGMNTPLGPMGGSMGFVDRARQMAAGRAPGENEKKLMGGALGAGTGALFGGPPGALIGGAMGYEMPPDNLGADTVGDVALGLATRGLNKFAPGLGRGIRNGVQGVANYMGRQAGSDIGEAAGQPPEANWQSGLAALFGGAFGGASPQALRVAPAFAADNDKLGALMANRKWNAYLRDSPEHREILDDFAATGMARVEAHTAPMSGSAQREFIDALGERIENRNMTAMPGDPIERVTGFLAKKGTKDMTPDTVIQEIMGSDPSQIRNSILFVRESFKDHPEAAEEFVNSFFTRRIIGEALYPIGEKATGKTLPGYVDKAVDMSKKKFPFVPSVGPGTHVPTETVLSAQKYSLDSEALQKSLSRWHAEDLELMFGKDSAKGLNDIMAVLTILDPNTKSLRTGAYDLINQGVKWNINRATFQTFAKIAAIGGMGGAAYMGVSPQAIAATAGGVGAAISLDKVLRSAAKNPEMARMVREVAESNDPTAFARAFNNLIQFDDDKFTSIEAPKNRPPLTFRGTPRND